MSDDRLFSLNNAICRKWYYINIVILAFLFFITNLIFTNYIIPNARTDEYNFIAKSILYFFFFFYSLTFLSLVERRLYDIAGTRDSKKYKIPMGFIQIFVIFQLFVVFIKWKSYQLPISIELLDLTAIGLLLLFIFIVFIIGFFKGSISNLTYDEYRKRTRYM